MIFNKLLPREGNFFELFDRHIKQVVQAAHAFNGLVAHYDNEADRKRYAQQVDDAEHAADRITHELIRTLHQTFITPIDREQILNLINAMDDVADLIQDCTEALGLYDVHRMTPEIVRLATLCVKCCERLAQAVNMLAEVRKPDVAEAALKTCEEIDRLESDADRELRSAISGLFRNESDVRELIKLKAIYELLEEITDRCEDVANLIEGVVLENA